MSALPKPRYPTKAKIRQLVEAFKAAGLDVGAAEVKPDGTVRLLPAKGVAATAFDRYQDVL